MNTKRAGWVISLNTVLLSLGAFLFGCGDFSQANNFMPAVGRQGNPALSIAGNQSGGPTTLPATGTGAPDGNRNLIWSDEFDGPAGSAPDPAKWDFVDVGGVEGLACETNTNATQDGNGNLVIMAKHEGPQINCKYGGPADYSTSRISTHGHFSQAYGRIEARIKLPYGKGIWAGWWGEGEYITPTSNWPANGEIDIMEERGSVPNSIQGAIHGTGFTGPLYTTNYTLPSGNFQDAYHIFAIEWSPNRIDAYVDSTLYKTWTPADLVGGQTWLQDHPFYWALSNQVGGVFDGNPDGTTLFPQLMIVDYVRVYAPAAPATLVSVTVTPTGAECCSR
jgi:beta-glucanase (GH16 family)